MTINKYYLDLTGLKCPVPVLKISRKYKEIKVGDIINVKCDDPKSENDINELCKSINIKLIEKKQDKNCLSFKLKKI